MQSFIESFLASKSFGVAAVAIAVLAAALLLSLSVRFAFRSRLRLPRNGRTRAPRLGLVDAFNLDRQRQLVIIRRDNVEHLLMIGGANDLVIESAIIRAENRELRSFREATPREPELRDKEREPQPSAAGVPWPDLTEALSSGPAGRSKTPSPAVAKAEPEDPVGGPSEGTARRPAPAAGPGGAIFSLSPKRGRGEGPGPTGCRESFLSRLNQLPAPEGETIAANSVRPAVAPPAFVRPPLRRQSERVSARPGPAETAGEALTAGQPAKSDVPARGNSDLASPTADAAGDSLSASPAPAAGSPPISAKTLEEEMARLLGRG